VNTAFLIQDIDIRECGRQLFSKRGCLCTLTETSDIIPVPDSIGKWTQATSTTITDNYITSGRLYLWIDQVVLNQGRTHVLDLLDRITPPSITEISISTRSVMDFYPLRIDLDIKEYSRDTMIANISRRVNKSRDTNDMDRVLLLLPCYRCLLVTKKIDDIHPSKPLCHDGRTWSQLTFYSLGKYVVDPPLRLSVNWIRETIAYNKSNLFIVQTGSDRGNFMLTLKAVFQSMCVKNHPWIIGVER